MDISKEDIQNTIVFLNRANLQGSEAATMALLLQKYAAELKPLPVPKK